MFWGVNAFPVLARSLTSKSEWKGYVGGVRRIDFVVSATGFVCLAGWFGVWAFLGSRQVLGSGVCDGMVWWSRLVSLRSCFHGFLVLGLGCGLGKSGDWMDWSILGVGSSMF